MGMNTDISTELSHCLYSLLFCPVVLSSWSHSEVHLYVCDQRSQHTIVLEVLWMHV